MKNYIVKKSKYGKNYYTKDTVNASDGGDNLPKQTIQVWGKNVQIMKAVPAPRQGWYINEFVERHDNLQGGQFKTKKQAEEYAKRYVKVNW